MSLFMYAATQLTPVQVIALSSLNIVKVLAGGFHTCAIVIPGSLYCWGANGDGQLGLGILGI
jgi:alpha-tubulin suppressor-like RCC1 family protein